jgi:hypothetical protein
MLAHLFEVLAVKVRCEGPNHKRLPQHPGHLPDHAQLARGGGAAQQRELARLQRRRQREEQALEGRRVDRVRAVPQVLEAVALAEAKQLNVQVLVVVAPGNGVSPIQQICLQLAFSSKSKITTSLALLRLIIYTIMIHNISFPFIITYNLYKLFRWDIFCALNNKSV